MIRFLLNDTPVVLDHLPPDLTLLQYLREQAGLTGSKEGCASGDCGACTVVMAEIVENTLQYRSINACITLLGTVHGKQVITVEGLGVDNKLHPAQQALVDQHASQCGFCTPGIVMSLYALQCNHQQASQQQIEQALAGNLCRCTGYRPILQAAQKLQLQQQPIDTANQCSEEQQQKTIRRLGVMQSTRQAGLSEQDRSLFIPTSIAELADLIDRHPQARLLAGGTDLVLEVTQQLDTLGQVIYLAAVEELQILEQHPDYISFGAAVSYTRAVAVIEAIYPDFATIIRRLGALQIRNTGTLGGNIANASPIGDTPPALLALQARLVLSNGRQQRTLPIADFFTGYRQTALQAGEFIVAIELPKPAPGSQFFMYKVSKRFEDDISAVCMAISMQRDGSCVQTIRIGCGGMAATPMLAENTANALLGQPWNESSIRRAQKVMAAEFVPLSDVRASAAYRLKVAQNLLQRCYLESTGTTAVQVAANV